VYRTIGLTGSQLAYYVVLFGLLFVSALLVRRQMGRVKTRGDAVMMGFGGLGFFVGLILGLSATPIVNAFMAAAFTLAGILLPMFDKNPAPGVAKNDRVRWMMPFGFVAGIGVFVGIAIRANDLLSAPEAPMRERIIAHGYSEEQADAMLKRWAEKSTPSQIIAPMERKSNSPLLSSSNSTGNRQPIPELAPLTDAMRKAIADTSKPLTPEQRLALLALDPTLKERIDLLRQQFTVDETLTRLRDELAKPN
jgi:MFS family permease